MASVSLSHLVLFIASILIAATVAGTLVTGVDRVSDALSDQSLDTSERIETEISVISDTGSDRLYDGQNVTILIKNTGKTTLPPDVDRVDILLNGVYIPPDDSNATIVDGTSPDVWGPNEVIEVTIDAGELRDGEHRVSASVHGNEDVVTFRVTNDA